MSDDRTDEHADAPTGDIDPEQLKQALGRTGRMLKSAGLPFEQEEFDDDGGDDSSDDDAPASSATPSDDPA